MLCTLAASLAPKLPSQIGQPDGKLQMNAEIKSPTTDAVAALADVNSQIAAAAEEDGRTAADIHLIAVSKTYDAAAIRPVLTAGHRALAKTASRKRPASGRRYVTTTPVSNST